MAVSWRIWFVTLWLLMLTITSHAAAPEQAATQKQIKQLQSRIEKLTGQMKSQEGESRKLSQSLKKVELQAGQLARQIRQLDQQLAGLGGRESDLEQRKARIESDLNQRAERLQQQLVSRYKSGNQPRLELLLNQRDPEALDRMLRYHDALSESLAKDIALFREQLSALKNTDTQLLATRQEIVQKQQQLQQELIQLQRTRDQRQQHLASLQETLRQGGSELKQLKLDQTRLQAILREIEASLNVAVLVTDDTPFKSRKGKLAWPVTGQIGRVFGSKQNNISYDGIWIKSEEGKAVRAVHHGRVVFSDWLRGYGLVTILDHGGGYLTLYGYNQSLLLEAGDWVAAGDAIATVGDSGGRQSTGLYFALRFKGQPKDPIGWLGRR
ncbi:murein hydrolase activator EnvC family protein [Pontibacter sp. JAM-7]|uniref:murein hydrolase activator EnvC family protein n=1 Tax=Pontibacter sp. JAM-7 TaxID=3366581 RepID=UPI003AF4B9EE